MQMLSIFVSEKHDDWDDHCPYLMMAYRATEQDSTKCTPNLLMFGQEIMCPIDLMYGPPPDREEVECPIEYVEWLQSAMQTTFEFAHKNLSRAAKRQKSVYDTESAKRHFMVGSSVWRYYPPTAGQKLGLGWTGPYLIVDKLSDLVYSIQRDPESRVINVHKDHLKAYLGDNNLPPWIFDEQDETEVSDQTPVIEGAESLGLDVTLDFEESEHSRPAPRITRAGRTIKPRDIYSP